MKLKKHISKILFCSILLNSISLYSNASNSNLNRYETLEGEFVDLGDIDSKDITEIEIFGNTIQDSNNLEDIQSVGELYVNEEGEPILDKQGREQYKIEIETSNKFNLSECFIEASEFKSDDEYIYVDKNKEFYIDLNLENTSRCIFNINGEITKSDNFGRFVFYYESTSSQGFYANTIPFTAELKSDKIIKFKWDNPFGAVSKIKKNDFWLSFTDYDSEYKSNKITILLPCQLMKIGNVADRLYWDNEKGRYIVEKNIIKEEILNTLNWSKRGDLINTSRFYASLPSTTKFPFNGGSWVALSTYITNKFKPASDMEDKVDTVSFGGVSPIRCVTVKKDIGTTIEEFKTSFNSFDVYFKVRVPELIETNITKKVKLTTYPEKTYVSTVNENGIKPTVKIMVDIIEEVSGEAVENAISSPTSNNIALARMFVNMLPESLYKDELQAKLNDIFSEDMVFDRLTATANLDVYIKSENILMMSLNTNTVTFEDYSGVEELELQDAINISINSSLPYQLNAYIVGDITNKDKDKTLDLDVLNIKDNSELEYKKFDSINSKLILLDNVSKGNDISHNIDLKLSGNKAHDADVYKTTIKFEAEQK